MFISYRITACLIALATAAVIVRLVRRNALHGGDAAWWLAASLFAVLAGLFPGGFDLLGHALGVSYPPILFILLALAAFAVRLLASDVERARMELTQRRLVQRHAELALRLRDIERELGLRGIALPLRPDPAAEEPLAEGALADGPPAGDAPPPKTPPF